MNKSRVIIGSGAAIFLLAFAVASVLLAQHQVSVTVSEAITNSSGDVVLVGFPGDTLQQNFSYNNAASHQLNISLSWLESSNPNNVIYTLNTTPSDVYTLLPGANTIAVDWHIAADSPVGTFAGNITSQRVQ